VYRVILSPESRGHLKELRSYDAKANSRRVADNYIRRIRKFYMGLALAPHRGEQRFAHRPGIRVIGFEHRITILFAVFDDDRRVEIIGFYYGGKSA
jgi:toxin ParE1/3/4